MSGVLSAQEVIREHLKQSAETKLRTADACAADIERAATLVSDSFKAGGKLLICGNGGSAADSQHMAAEFVSRLTLDFERPGLPAIALTTDTSVLTAYANDFDFAGVFARQVQALGRAGDVLLGISTGGSAANVIAAVHQARALGLRTIALAAQKGELAGVVDVAIRVPSAMTAHIQEAHLAIEHTICHLVERLLFQSPI
jgi:D-sedoheptulose 7-phosphate isomerase